MTETTELIFKNHEVRKSKKQKESFRKFVLEFCEKNNYNATIEKSHLGAKNIVIGDVDSAKAVFTAHYDTCSALPFPNFITPKNFLIYLLYQLSLTVIIFAVIFGAKFLAVVGFSWIADSTGSTFFQQNILPWIPMAVAFIILLLLVSGPANKHTANDNTSGVTTLLDIMSRLDDAKKSEVAFVFFDLEESGLLGSSGFAAKHKKAMKHKLIINFDCVSDGEHMLFVLKKGARCYDDVFNNVFAPTDEIKSEIATRWIFYPSDQANFKMGVGVASLKRSRNGILYMDRIHTKRDTVYREKNIEFLVKGSIKLLDLI